MDALTFGVKLEAVFFYSRDYDRLNEPPGDLPPLIDMTYEEFKKREDRASRCVHMTKLGREKNMAKEVEQRIMDFARALPRDSRGFRLQFPDYTSEDPHRVHHQWRVKVSPSIKLDEQGYDGLDYGGLEILSPALYIDERSFREVKEVTDWLRKTFRTAVPPSCGLHVHIGYAKSIIPLRTLQKLAAICWAGDTLFQQMHPVSRRFNHHCLGPRVKSNLGDGRKAGDYYTEDDRIVLNMRRLSSITMAAREIADNREPDVAALPACIQSITERGLARRLENTKFDRTKSRIKHAEMPSKEETEICEKPAYQLTIPDQPLRLLKGHGILTGARELFSCLNYNAVASLMSSNAPGAYCFENYLDRKRNVEMRYNGKPVKTVVFRQAAGSLDGHWVGTYARICIGIARFADTATMPKVWQLIYECHLAETSQHQYDVIDLLLDLELPKEAEFVHNRLEKGSLAEEMLQPFLSGKTCTMCDHILQRVMAYQKSRTRRLDRSEVLENWEKCEQW
ncbi:putative amidoligase enzyme-domain-containing protein [Rostrohypoxylon terebratum]|nr:putative amidoligase enzyme-domain-containing protein [Rostrohypoxylon terebratum]